MPQDVIDNVSRQQNLPNYFTQFVNAYVGKNHEEQKKAFECLTKQSELASITPLQFGNIANYLASEHIIKLYNAILFIQPAFIKNSTELTQVCVGIQANQISIFCDSMKSILERPGLIDNARELLAIFSPRVYLADGTRFAGLNTEQLQRLFDSLKPIIAKSEFFFTTLLDFVNIFLQSPNLDSKEFLCQILESQLLSLTQQSNDIHRIAQALYTMVDSEKAIFKQARDTIFREFIRSRRSPHAFFATLFIIADHYPGRQKEKLQKIMDATSCVETSDPLLIQKIISKTNDTMDQEKITSTRLRRALTQLMHDLAWGKPIDIDYIKEVSQDKNTVR